MIFQYQERNQICNLKTISQEYNGVKNKEKTIYFYSIGCQAFMNKTKKPLPCVVFQGERKSLSYSNSRRK